MRRIPKLIQTFLIGLLVAWMAPCLADEPGRGGESGAFLRMGLGARSLALGGAGTALAGDGHALYYNPAALVSLDGRWGGAELRLMSLDRRATFIGYAQSIGAQEGGAGRLQGGFGLGWISAGVFDIDGRDFTGQHTDMLSADEHAFCFGFALSPGPGVALGLTGKLLLSRLGGVTDDDGALSARGFGFDLGVRIQPTQDLALAATVKDLRARYTWDTQELYDMGTQTVEAFPLRMELGVLYRLRPWGVLIALDGQKIEGRPWRLLAGAEWQALGPLILRAGLRAGEPTFGLGFVFHQGSRLMRLDYALVPDPVTPSPDHLVTWAVHF